jgi:hypothetical protein
MLNSSGQCSECLDDGIAEADLTPELVAGIVLYGSCCFRRVYPRCGSVGFEIMLALTAGTHLRRTARIPARGALTIPQLATVVHSNQETVRNCLGKLQNIELCYKLDIGRRSQLFVASAAGRAFILNLFRALSASGKNSVAR